MTMKSLLGTVSLVLLLGGAATAAQAQIAIGHLADYSGGTGSIMGTLMGTAFVVLLPESMEWISAGLKGSAIDKALSLNNNITFLREIAIGLIIIAFLMFEPDGLAHRWRQIKTYWKLYPFSH